MILEVIPQVDGGDRYLVVYGHQMVAVDVCSDGTIEAVVPLGRHASPRAVRAAVREVRRIVEEEEAAD